MLYKWQHYSKVLKENNLFQLSVILIILISSLTIGVRTYDVHSIIIDIVRWTDWLITLFFLSELIIRISAEEKWYHFFKLNQPWNWFDFIIVACSLIPLDNSDYALLGRLLRLFRVMRLISFIPQLRLLTQALIIALPRMGYVALMMFVIFYMYAAFGSLLFSDINPTLWGNVGKSLLTLFRVATFEDWTDVMYETMEIYPLSWIYYVTFIFLSAFVFLNMMIGIIINVLEEEHQKIAKAEQTSPETPPDNHQDLTTVHHKIDQLSQQIQQLQQTLQQHNPTSPK